jgi:hypothetical protein
MGFWLRHNLLTQVSLRRNIVWLGQTLFSLVTFFGRAKKVTRHRAAPGKLNQTQVTVVHISALIG